jgi:uncharacterized protein
MLQSLHPSFSRPAETQFKKASIPQSLKFQGANGPDKDSDDKPPAPPSIWDRFSAGGLFGKVTSVATEFFTDPKAAFQKNVENQLLYHPVVGGVSITNIQDPVLKAKVQDVTFTTTDGVKIHGWYVPPAPGKETIVFAHGNAGNISHREFIMRPSTDQGYGFLAFDYRGFGNSEGVPGEKGLYLDFEAASQFLATQHNTPTTKQIAAGESLGGAVAIDAASKRPYRMLFVLSTFTSLGEIAGKVFENAPVVGSLSKTILPSLLQQEFLSLNKIANIKTPILIAHGDQDQLVPVEMADRLYEGATQSVYKDIVIAEGCDHNNVFMGIPGDLMTGLDRVLSNTQPIP